MSKLKFGKIANQLQSMLGSTKTNFEGTMSPQRTTGGARSIIATRNLPARGDRWNDNELESERWQVPANMTIWVTTRGSQDMRSPDRQNYLSNDEKLTEGHEGAF